MNTRMRFTSLVILASFVGGACSSQENSEVATSHAALVAGAGEAILTNTSVWNTGYCSEVKIYNRGSSPITNWTLGIDLKQSVIDNAWNGIVSGAGSSVTVKPDPNVYNANIPVGSSPVVFGFCAHKTGADFQAVVSSLVVVAGPVGSGGAPATGGAPNTGGTSAAGGTTEAGGTSAAGGTTEAGGTSAAGGTTATGGTGTGGTFGDGIVTLKTVVDSWPTGYCDTFTITNVSTLQVTNWTLELDVGTAIVGNQWGVTAKRNENLVTVTPLVYNATIAPGATTQEFGICASIADATNHLAKLVALKPVTANPPGSGGAPGAGGTGSGGSSGASTGGAATGGVTETGGNSATGGTTATGGASSTGLSASLNVNNDWGKGYCAEVTVSAGNSAVSTWAVVLDLHQSTVNNLWNGTYVTSGSLITVSPMSYNKAIAVGQKTSFGFCGVPTGSNYKPTLVSP
ncbi:MAG TPA: cellulose binding domain-containing protein [Polyangiaceae bacterium]